MHLLRLLPGGLPGRCDRRGAEFRIRHRDPRGAVLRQGKALGEWRPLGSRDRPRPRPRGALPMSSGGTILPSPPFRGEREGPAPTAREGEVGVGNRSGIRHLTPTLSAPGGGEGVAAHSLRSRPSQPKTAIPAKAGPLHNSGVRPRSWKERIRSNTFAELSNPDCPAGIPNLSPEDPLPELCKGPAFAGVTDLGISSRVARFSPASSPSHSLQPAAACAS